MGKKTVGYEPGKTLDEIERDVILEAFNYHKQNMVHTARSLGVSRATLYRKIQQYTGDREMTNERRDHQAN